VFFLVDAFTDTPYKGNPAGVCILDEYPPDSGLQSIAKYYNWSEIAFVKRNDGNSFYIRWFSPNDEAPLCGHATLAAAHVVFWKQLVDGDNVDFEYQSGHIFANRDGPAITMEFPIFPVKRCERVPFVVKDVIGIREHLEIVYDKTMFIIVLRTAQDVVKAVPDFSAIQAIDCRAIAITAVGPEGFDFCSRYFAPKVGIFEDPVCGSMHCRLAHYWGIRLGTSQLRAFQASKRTGVVGLKIVGDVVRITGTAVSVLEICQPHFHVR
jgi:predicted PhzF superfamily epimerase YddE/YHI9